MVIESRIFKNIPVWFKTYIQNPFGSGVPKFYIKKANEFMEKNNIIYVDSLSFSDNAYSAIPAFGDLRCPCLDLKVTRFFKKDNE